MLYQTKTKGERRRPLVDPKYLLPDSRDAASAVAGSVHLPVARTAPSRPATAARRIWEAGDVRSARIIWSAVDAIDAFSCSPPRACFGPRSSSTRSTSYSRRWRCGARPTSSDPRRATAVVHPGGGTWSSGRWAGRRGRSRALEARLRYVRLGARAALPAREFEAATPAVVDPPSGFGDAGSASTWAIGAGCCAEGRGTAAAEAALADRSCSRRSRSDTAPGYAVRGGCLDSIGVHRNRNASNWMASPTGFEPVFQP